MAADTKYIYILRLMLTHGDIVGDIQGATSPGHDTVGFAGAEVLEHARRCKLCRGHHHCSCSVSVLSCSTEALRVFWDSTVSAFSVICGIDGPW